MCTRYYIEKDIPAFADISHKVKNSALADRIIHTMAKPIITSGEVRPTDIVPVIAPDRHGNRSAFPMKWGYTLPKSNKPVVNARSETAADKPMFKDDWRSHRCIVPSSWYFEWEHFTSADGKTITGDKYMFQPLGSTITYLCGLYRFENDFPVFAILTREPSAEIRRFHDRMPLILPEDRIDEWINPESVPEDILPYVLTDIIAEPADSIL
ncbi:MAG: SOS response-associated peptidase [Lachnospiraceae bacterium]|nr:SOS response-associated peptidase [Lachnospiraceae bacterium]